MYLLLPPDPPCNDLKVHSRTPERFRAYPYTLVFRVLGYREIGSAFGHLGPGILKPEH